MNKKALETIQQQLNYGFYEINYYIHILYQSGDLFSKNIILNHLWNRVAHLQFLNQLLISYMQQPTSEALPITPAQPPLSPQTVEKTFTREELKNYDGKNGRPAYVAVNGIVYDVTNNAAWAAATHFGLAAGNDLSSQFQSCHPKQLSILNKLKVVGRLV